MRLQHVLPLPAPRPCVCVGAYIIGGPHGCGDSFSRQCQQLIMKQLMQGLKPATF